MTEQSSTEHLNESWLGRYAAAIRERDELRAEVKRLQAALQGLLPLLALIEDEPETDAEILRAIWDARLALDPSLARDKE